MKIFVSIASYQDPLLFFTINDAIKKAAKPDKLFFGIVDQNDNDQRLLVENHPHSKQIRYVYVHALDTLGVCWARNIAFSLYNGEDFLLQIDSHMLFEENWDMNLIEQYNVINKTSDKPIITTYPYNFEFDENRNPVYNRPSGETVLVLRPHPETRLTEENAVLRFRANHKFTDQPVLGCHIAAGFIFTAGTFVEEVPYDPYLYFHGEEQSLSLRAFTRGWDIYHPVWIPLYHFYKKPDTDYTTHHWHDSIENKRSMDYTTLRSRAYERVKKMLYENGMGGTAYGLGNQRTLQEYKVISGIDYENRLIEEIEL